MLPPRFVFESEKRFVLFLHQFRQSEVQNFYIAVRAHHDVFGLDVTVHQMRGVRGTESVGDLDRNLQHVR